MHKNQILSSNFSWKVLFHTFTTLTSSLWTYRYSGPLLNPSNLNNAVQGGPKSTEYTALISWLCDQISKFGQLDDTVHKTSSPDDASHFLLELSTFLKELGCTNKKLTTGNVNQRLANLDERVTLIEYLIVEVMTGVILECKKPENNKAVEITIVSTYCKFVWFFKSANKKM